MKMSNNDASHIQFDMYLITVDGEPNCPLMICAGGGTDEEDMEDWVRSVNLIYRCLRCGLWTADPFELDWLSRDDMSNYSFCKKLSESNPFDLDLEDTIGYWMGTYIFNTEIGYSFIKGFGMKKLKNDIYPPFIEALEELFRKNGVPWEAGDLFDMRRRFG